MPTASSCAPNCPTISWIMRHACKAIVRHGVGLDFIPVAAATARGIAVANLPGSNTNAVAEYVMSALMHLRRPLYRLDSGLRSDGWNAARPAADGFTELGTTTLGILGVGTIGRHLAKHRARRFRDESARHLPPQGIAARRHRGSLAARPVRTQRCDRGLLRADRRNPRAWSAASSSPGCGPTPCWSTSRAAR